MGENTVAFQIRDHAISAGASNFQLNDEVSPEKACELLKDGSVHGQELTEDQRGYFGSICEERNKMSSNFKWVDVANAFCATGEGGGVDPSCSPGEGGGSSTGRSR